MWSFECVSVSRCLECIPWLKKYFLNVQALCAGVQCRYAMRYNAGQLRLRRSASSDAQCSIMHKAVPVGSVEEVQAELQFQVGVDVESEQRLLVCHGV